MTRTKHEGKKPVRKGECWGARHGD